MTRTKNTKERSRAYRTLTVNRNGLGNLEEIIAKARKAGYSLFM